MRTLKNNVDRAESLHQFTGRHRSRTDPTHPAPPRLAPARPGDRRCHPQQGLRGAYRAGLVEASQILRNVVLFMERDDVSSVVPCQCGNTWNRRGGTCVAHP